MVTTMMKITIMYKMTKEKEKENVRKVTKTTRTFRPMVTYKTASVEKNKKLKIGNKARQKRKT